VLPAGGKHQQGLGFKMHGFMQKQLPELFTQRCATGFAGLHDGNAPGLDQGDGGGDLAALAGTVNAFKGDEAGFHGCCFRI
jgi:hypothetical protein